MNNFTELHEGTIFRHFKNNLYEFICIATDATNSADGRELVIYKSLDDHGCATETYARYFNEFFGEVDHEKYPDAKQKNRFEAVGFIGELDGSDIQNVAYLKSLKFKEE